MGSGCPKTTPDPFRYGWQWVFPSQRMAKDPRTRKLRRHHVSEDYFGEFFKQAIADDDDLSARDEQAGVGVKSPADLLGYGAGRRRMREICR